MQAVVLLKQVLDPEIPQKAFGVDPDRKVPQVDRAPQVLSIFDGNALELALRLRESREGVRIVALTLGPAGADDVLRKALALTVDEAVRVSADSVGLDSQQKARLLAAAIGQMGPVDLVLSGRQAADWEAGQVGAMVAEALSLPCVPFVSRVEGSDPLLVRQQLESGHAILRIPGPAVLTVTNDETNVLRPAKVKDVMAASRRQIRVLDMADLGPLDLGEPQVDLLSLSLPPGRAGAEMIEGESAQAKAQALARRLRQIGAV
ncbi:MAG: electron transfer flavoprotein subunit beta/FixA family protein [Thermaerobacter sp.]|nr:electron transfer flavoprotein subunit beta/FixA family protein [Thermaerobacter sp.]